jgi:protein-tyrosine-phosphatase
MAEKNIDVSGHFPKSITAFPKGRFDVVINMSGFPLPGHPNARDWNVDDPFGGTEEQYRATRDHIENLVMKLILELRRAKR